MGLSVQDIVGGSIADAVARIISLFKVDPTVALQKQVELQELQLNIQSTLANKIQDAVNDQIEVNKQEAASGSIFIAGWRPFLGWCCGLGLFVQFIVNPLATWFAALAHHPIQFPSLDLGTLMTLLFGMLGLAAGEHTENIMTSQAGQK